MTAADTAKVRIGLAIGPALACLGIAWTAIAPSAFSSAAVLAGLLASFFATHRFGRLGADVAAPEASAGADDETAAKAAKAAVQAEADEAERVRKEREAARAKARTKAQG